MTIKALRDVLHKAPYQPFRLQLGDGTEVDITHPECVAFHQNDARILFIATPDGGVTFVDLMLVVAIHIDELKSKGRKKS